MNDDSEDYNFIIRKKSNTFNLKQKIESSKDSTDIYNSMGEVNNKKKKFNKNNNKNKKENIKENIKEHLIDNDEDGTISNDRTKEIDIMLSDPDISIVNNETFQKLLKNLGMGSICRIIINLSITNISISSLNLSQKIFYISIYIYPLLIIIIGIISNWTLNITLNLAVKYKKRTYGGVIKEVFFKQLLPIYIFLLIITYFGNIIIEEMIVYRLICDIILKFFENRNYNLSELKTKFYILYGFSFLILLPIFQKKNYSQISIFEIIIFNIILLILLTNFILIFIYNFNFDSFKKNFIINEEYFLSSNNEIFNSIVVLFYSYNYHYNFFQIVEKLPINSFKRINITKRTVIIDIVLNLLIGAIGFFSLSFNKENDLIIFRNSEIEKNNIFSDWLMTVGRIIYFIYLIFKLLKDYQNLRNIILKNIFCYNTNNVGKFINIITSFFILLFTTLIPIYFQHISESICLIGACCSVHISFIIPLIMFIKENEYYICHWKNFFTSLLICFLLIISAGSLLFTIIKILHLKND